MKIPEFGQTEIKNYVPQKTELTNGIPVYTFFDKEMEVVFFKIVFYNAGTIFQDKFFVASLTKTQLAQDTLRYSAMELADEMDYYGINFSHSTSNERTVLTFSFLKQYSSQAIKLIEQILIYPVFKQEKLDITVNNSRQEFLAKCQQTSFLAHRQVMAHLFGKDNPYGRYASFEDYGKINIEDIKTFYKQRYTYNQCYIVISGNADGQVHSMLNDSLGKSFWNKDSADTSARDVKITLSEENKRVVTELDSAVQASVAMAKIFPDVHHSDYIPLTVLNCLFGGYFNSRLMSEIREKRGYTYGIDSVIAPFSKGSVFMIVTDVNDGTDELTVQQIYKEMDILCKEPVSQEELTLVKNYMTGEILRNNDGVTEISESYDAVVRFNFPDNYTNIVLDRIRAVTASDIMTLAGKYFKDSGFVISICKKTK